MSMNNNKVAKAFQSDIDNSIFSFSRNRMIRHKEPNTNGELFVSSFDSDLLRATSSAAFRRMQDKTQLFPLEPNDYARSRLTHSSEVAATGKAIAFLVGGGIKNVYGTKIIGYLNNVVNICCYLHDIGNPPFGHYGEDIIRNYFKDNWNKLIFNDNGNYKTLNSLFGIDSQEYYDFVNFDGNAQALRVVTKLESFHSNVFGLNLTSAVLGGLIKYPFNSLHALNNRKFGYFKSEQQVIEFLELNRDFYSYKIHPAALIMEAADDICMFVSDLEDSIKKGVISANHILTYRTPRGKNGTKSPCIAFKKEFSKAYKKSMSNSHHDIATMDAIRPLLYKIKNQFISSVASIFIKYADKIMNGDKMFERRKEKYLSLIKMSELYPIIEMKNKILEKNVYSCKPIILPELKGDVILTNILNHYCHSILDLSESEIRSFKSNTKKFKTLRMISKNYLNRYFDSIDVAKKEGKYTPEFDAYCRLRLIVDDISGMTDNYALTLSKELTI